MGRIVRRIFAVLLLLVFCWLASVPARVWWVARADDRPASDAIVVLGAAQYDGRPSAVFEARLRHAKSLYEADVSPRIVTVGGGAPGDRTTEAAAGRSWLIDNSGLPQVDVYAAPEGTNTQESIEAVAALMAERGWTSAVIVTDPWHSFRSLALARAAGIDAVSSPVRSGPVVSTRAIQARYILRESAAYLQWRVTGSSGTGGPEAVS